MIEHETSPEEKMLVANLALKNYKAAAYGLTKFEELNSKVVLEVGRQVKKEITSYSKDPSSVFKYRGDLEQLAEFKNGNLIKDIEEKIPTLHYLVKASFRTSQKLKNPVNKKALIISSFLNLWMPISNFAYRINTILVLRGCKKEEVDCFHKLGLCSHPNTLRNMQTKAAVSFDKPVIEWKNNAVNRNKRIKFLEEVIGNLNVDDENAMEICTVYFSVETVSRCKHYCDEVYRACKEMLSQNPDDLFEDTDILSVLEVLKGENTQKFRYI